MISEKISELEAEAKKLKKLKKKFPDLKEDRDRWGTIRLYSKSVNSKVTDITTRHSCGCCDDSPLYAMPYLKYEGVEIHSDPVQICIGYRNPNGGKMR